MSVSLRRKSLSAVRDTVRRPATYADSFEPRKVAVSTLATSPVNHHGVTDSGRKGMVVKRSMAAFAVSRRIIATVVMSLSITAVMERRIVNPLSMGLCAIGSVPIAVRRQSVVL